MPLEAFRDITRSNIHLANAQNNDLLIFYIYLVFALEYFDISDAFDCVNGKKKRDVNYTSMTNGTQSILPAKRSKRNILLTKERKIECTSLWNGVAAYWKPTYDIPQYCFSKLINCF